MLSFALIAVLVSFSSAFTLPQTDVIDLPSLISSTDCDFYSALNSLYQCGAKSHLMGYSLKYCQRLVDTRPTFENIQYQADAQQCLQQNLYNKIRQAAAGTITCDTFQKMDLESFGTCYGASFKQLSANDIRQLFVTYRDTTLAFPEFCKLANSVAGHWSQLVNGDLMQFIKSELKTVFPEGDTSACTIKDIVIPDIIEEIITDVTKIVDAVNNIKDDILVIIEKAKAIRDDFKSIQDIIKGIKNGSIAELDGIKSILQKTQDIVANARTIINTIKNIVKSKATLTSNSTDVGTDIDRALQDMITIIDQIEALKGEIYKVIDNVNNIIDTINEIRDGKKDIFDGLEDIVNQLSDGVDNIYSIINTSYTLKEIVIDLVQSIVTDVSGIIDGAGGIIDEIVGGVSGGIGGALGGLGK